MLEVLLQASNVTFEISNQNSNFQREIQFDFPNSSQTNFLE